jgi:hypothetical protein
MLNRFPKFHLITSLDIIYLKPLSNVSTYKKLTIDKENLCLASLSNAVQFKHQTFDGCMNVQCPCSAVTVTKIILFYSCLKFVFVLFLSPSQKNYFKKSLKKSLTIYTDNLDVLTRAEVNLDDRAYKNTLLQKPLNIKQYT